MFPAWRKLPTRYFMAREILRIVGVPPLPGLHFFWGTHRMYMLYIDASGTPEVSNPDNQLYVMLGLCLHESQWQIMEERISLLKQKYQFPGIPFELHAKDFCVSIREQEKIPEFEQLDWTARRDAVMTVRDQKLAGCSGEQRRKLKDKYRETNPFVHLSRRERSQLFEESLDLVGAQDGIRLFGEVADKHFLFKLTGHQDVMRGSFEQVVSRFDVFLTKHNKGLSKSHRGDKGLLVIDNEPTYEGLISKLFMEYRKTGHAFGSINHVIEVPFFVESREVSAVQVIDLCAYAVRRYVERARNGDTPEKKNFLRIYHRFEREGPKLHGLRHYCRKNTCPCIVCMDRGHYIDPQLELLAVAAGGDDPRKPAPPYQGA